MKRRREECSVSKFDKELRNSSRNMKLPEQYNKRIDEVLSSMPEKELMLSQNKSFKGVFVAVFCLVLVGIIISTNITEVKAGFFEGFKLKIMDIFNIKDMDGSNVKEPDKLGIDSEEQNVTSKPDLMIELRETIADKKNIYLLVEVTAPASVEFDKDILFEYYAFCKGTNYVAENILGGAKTLELFEIQQNSKNRATYLISILSVDEIEEDTDITLSLKNLMRNPTSDNPEMLVEGIWSITFSVDHTVREEIVIDSYENIEFPFINTTAKLENVRITPLGMTFTSDVTNFPYEDLAITDTSISLRIKMIDGTEYIIESHDFEEMTFVSSGAINYVEDGNRWFKQSEYTFEEQIDVNKIMGIYVEDIFIPVN